MAANRNDASIADCLTALNSGFEDEDRLSKLMHYVGEAGERSCAPTIAQYLGHPSDRIRHMAVHVLLHHYKLMEYADDAWRMLLTDPSDYVKEAAMNGLSSLYQGSRNTCVCGKLVQAVRQMGSLDEHTASLDWRRRGVDALLWTFLIRSIAWIMGENPTLLKYRTRVMSLDELDALIGTWKREEQGCPEDGLKGTDQ